MAEEQEIKIDDQENKESIKLTTTESSSKTGSRGQLSPRESITDSFDTKTNRISGIDEEKGTQENYLNSIVKYPNVLLKDWNDELVECDGGNLSPYSTSPYHSINATKEPELMTGYRNVHITAVNSVSSPVRSGNVSPIVSIKSAASKVKFPVPNQFRAFGYRALSFQQRQWFTNICCVVYLYIQH
jgi:hypothetical protein